jgi:anti-sigma regulatory factor (Ser/Thr protein kinase)
MHCPGHHDGLTDDALLLVSEVVTNAYLHGAPPITLELTCDGDAGLVVRVSDGSTASPRPNDLTLDGESGRGVALVAVISDDWGVEPTAAGKQVWFRLRRPSATG